MNTQSNTPSIVSKNNDYYANHSLGVKWPFTIYHRPIELSMLASIEAARLRSRNRLKVLVFGCGLFHENTLFPKDIDLTLVDSDERLCSQLDRQLKGFSKSKVIISLNSNDLKEVLPPESYDLIIAKEVIEHIADMDQYFLIFKNSLCTGGTLWLSTPNYGGFLLPLIEYTFLEILARIQGFSRFGIHPNKYSKRRLQRELAQGGFNEVKVLSTSLWLSLVATCRKN